MYQQVKVVGLPDRDLGEVPVAIVKCAQSLRLGLADQLQQRVLLAFGAEKAIRAVHYLDQLGYGDFPTNEMGKVLRTELARAVANKVQRIRVSQEAQL